MHRPRPSRRTVRTVAATGVLALAAGGVALAADHGPSTPRSRQVELAVGPAPVVSPTVTPTVTPTAQPSATGPSATPTPTPVTSAPGTTPRRATAAVPTRRPATVRPTTTRAATGTTTAPRAVAPVGVPSALGAAVGRIPGYRSGVVSQWVWSDRYGHYGATNLYTREVTISPRVPSGILYPVVVHEYSHALVIWLYGSSSRADAALVPVFGGSAATARERAADCMAIVQGAWWTNYTSCSSPAWRQAARTLVAGRLL